MKGTWLVEDREAKIRGLHLGIFTRGIKQEILRLEIPMHNTKRVARLHHPNNGLYQLCSLSLAVMPLLNDPVKKLTSGTQLHHKVHEHRILVRPLYLNNVGML
ncbi:hypothetical protein V8G54_027999 [Vigna mungo]|uniref:Uncharacterized protein n=1 Tax=Vigna mungo TaxID=3915 RepID=A0AAQ3RKH9_VIGMU